LLFPAFLRLFQSTLEFLNTLDLLCQQWFRLLPPALRIVDLTILPDERLRMTPAEAPLRMPFAFAPAAEFVKRDRSIHVLNGAAIEQHL